MADRGRGVRGRGGQGGDYGRGRGFEGNRGRGDNRGGRAGFATRGGSRGAPFLQNGRVNALDQSVTQRENDSFSGSLESSLQGLSMKNGVTGPTRPAYATKGRPIMLWANYFEMLPNRDQAFNRYDVSILPEKKGDEPKGRKRERIVQLLLLLLPQNIPVATDFASTLIASQTLGFTDKEYLVTYYPETENSPGQNAPRFRVKVQFTGTLRFGALLDYLTSTSLHEDAPAGKQEIIQAANIILGHGMRSNGRILTKSNKRGNKYYPYEGNLVENRMLKHGLQAFRGFFMSVRPATGRILLNVQVQHIAVWEALPLVRLLDKLRADGMSPSDSSRAISGLWVHASHLNNRLKRVAGFATGAEGRRDEHPPQGLKVGADANTVRFWKDSLAPPRYVSVTEHFRQTYNKTLQYATYPVLNVGTRASPVFLPAEVCTVKRKQDYQNKLSPEATAAMIQFAVRQAPVNAATISGNGVSMLRENSKSMFDKFGIGFKTDMITVQGRVLSGVSLGYANGTREARDASWNMRDVKFSKGTSLPKWSYLVIRTKGNMGAFENMDEAKSCVQKFATTLGKCGVQASQPLPGKALLLNNVQDPGPEIEKFFKSINSAACRLLLVLLPFQSTTIYNAVKRAGDIVTGIHTVDVVADSRKFAKALTSDNSQYFANVALKFNLKLGGQNQLLRPADLGFVHEGKTMLVGMDVTHPAPGSLESAPSVSSIVASIDKSLGQWPADVNIQTGRKEMIEGLKDMFKSRLKLWQKFNANKLPEEILIYRDGVGETMYDLIREIELPQIREACKEMYPAQDTKASKPYITIVICGKRHHTRFYPTKEEDADGRTGGTKNGTVVDRGITETRRWDFYLQAHTALQGTPKSAHYEVVHDEIFRRRAVANKINDGRTVGQRAADDLESLTHALSYMFGRATKAVSLVPPAYYADLVCDRARRWLSRVFDERTIVSSEGGTEATAADVTVHPLLRDTMFYI